MEIVLSGIGLEALSLSIRTSGVGDSMPETNSSPEIGSEVEGRAAGSLNKHSLNERPPSVTKC